MGFLFGAVRRAVGAIGATIDRIDIAEFETADEQLELLQKKAPAFLRQ
jgi:hypothetical protein